MEREKKAWDIVSETKFCHCGHIANRYMIRTFVNQLNQTVYRGFYRCTNCWSRINEDFNPTIDAMETINILDLRKPENIAKYKKID